MKLIRYFFEYVFIIILFGLLRLLGYRIASEIGCFLGRTFGPLFRSKKINYLKVELSIEQKKQFYKYLNERL